MPPYKFPVEAGHIVQFARSLGNDILSFDDPHLIAPPTFIQCGTHFDPDWPFRPGNGQEPLSDELSESGTLISASPRMLHAEQHFEYFRPVVPGMVLSVTTTPGRTWTKRGKHDTTLHFAESVSNYVDDANQLVVRARLVAVTVEKAGQEED
jgi:hypothetical protein